MTYEIRTNDFDGEIFISTGLDIKTVTLLEANKFLASGRLGANFIWFKSSQITTDLPRAIELYRMEKDEVVSIILFENEIKKMYEMLVLDKI